MHITLNVNQEKHILDLPPMKRLLDVLREDLKLTGTKEGCGEGECGACTVLWEGEAVNACLIPVCQASGVEITTIEGLSKAHGDLTPLQRAFVEFGGTQCGICTPGMILSARALLDTNPSPSREEVRLALAGNLCRCTGYKKIIDSVCACV